MKSKEELRETGADQINPRKDVTGYQRSEHLVV